MNSALSKCYAHVYLSVLPKPKTRSLCRPFFPHFWFCLKYQILEMLSSPFNLLYPNVPFLYPLCITASGKLLASGNISLKLFMAPLERIELLILERRRLWLFICCKTNLGKKCSFEKYLCFYKIYIFCRKKCFYMEKKFCN